MNAGSRDGKLIDCDICKVPATRIIFSNEGRWHLCASDDCWDRLTSQYKEEGLTWLQRPLVTEHAEPGDEEGESHG